MIVETGIGISSANSYASVAAADAYHEARQNTAWGAATVAAKAAALVRATDYIETSYRAIDLRLTLQQGLQFPVLSGLPSAIVAATIILALYALDGPLQAPATRGVKSLKVAGKSGSKETTFDDASSGDPFPFVTQLLVGYAAPVSATGSYTVGRLTR